MAYVAPLPKRLFAAAAKIETTYGTDPTPSSSTNAVRLARDLWSTIQPTHEWPNLRDDTANNSLVPIAAAPATGKKVRFTIQWEAKGGGATYNSSTSFDADPLLQACGWAGTFSTSPTPQWTYAPVTTGSRPSCSVYGWAGGNQYKVSGVRGNFAAQFRSGQISLVTFTLEGLLTALPSAAAVPAASYTAVIPPPAVSQACTIGPWTPDYDLITLQSQNDCQWLYSGNATDGLQSYDYGIARPMIEVTGRSVGQGTYDPMADWNGATSRAFTMTLGSTQYNKLTLAESAAWIPSEPTNEDQKGFTGWRVSYRCLAPTLVFN